MTSIQANELVRCRNCEGLYDASNQEIREGHIFGVCGRDREIERVREANRVFKSWFAEIRVPTQQDQKQIEAITFEVVKKATEKVKR